MSVWSYIWIVALLKIPTITFVWLLWRAARDSGEARIEPAPDGGGGSKLRLDRHPRPRVPRRPRRGPHGAQPMPPPVRIRTVNARARVLEH